MTILIFLLILSFLVIIHELGHFITARIFRITIEEFGLGIPPKVKTLFTWKGVPFTLNALPLGGFVRMEGEDGSDQPAESSVVNSNSRVGVSPTFPFYTRPAWQRLIVILAGASINFIFGVLAFTIIFSQVGIPERTPHPMIAYIADDSPAEQAGMQIGDQVLSIQAETQSNGIAIESIPQFIEEVKKQKGSTILVNIQRNDTQERLRMYVRKDDEIPAGEGALGVALEQTEMKRYPWYEMPFRAAVVGLTQSVEFGYSILSALGTMVKDLAQTGKVPSEVAGPVGIAYQAGKESLFSHGPLMILNFMALLSINLAIMNVLPIPALDGGRALFILLERVIPKSKRAKIEQRVNGVGFIFLISLILLITIKDVVVIITDKF